MREPANGWTPKGGGQGSGGLRSHRQALGPAAPSRAFALVNPPWDFWQVLLKRFVYPPLLSGTSVPKAKTGLLDETLRGQVFPLGLDKSLCSFQEHHFLSNMPFIMLFLLPAWNGLPPPSETPLRPSL